MFELPRCSSGFLGQRSGLIGWYIGSFDVVAFCLLSLFGNGLFLPQDHDF